MKVSLDSSRLLHLLVLLGVSYAGGKLVLHFLDGWSPLSAYGLAITVVCQVNQILLQLGQPQIRTLGHTQTAPAAKGNGKDKGEEQGERNKADGGAGNPKKKKK